MGWWINLYGWIAFLILGVLVGVTAFIVDVMAEYLTLWKW